MKTSELHKILIICMAWMTVFVSTDNEKLYLLRLLIYVDMIVKGQCDISTNSWKNKHLSKRVTL